MSKNRVSGSTSNPQHSGAAFHKDVPQPTSTPQQPEFDPTRPRAFDLGAFISGAKDHASTRTIPVTSRPAVAAELERLTIERDALAHRTSEDGTPGPARRLSATSPSTARLKAIEERIAELEPQLEGTWLLVKIRGLEPAEQDDVRRQNLPLGVELAAAIFEITSTVARPEDRDDPDAWGRLSAAEWEDLFAVIGSGQYATLDKANSDVSYQAVTPDFFERYSASQTTRSTSSS